MPRNSRSPLITVRIVTRFSDRVVGNDVENEIFFTVVDDLVWLACSAVYGVTGTQVRYSRGRAEFTRPGEDQVGISMA
jgi:hypothetical protein